MDDRLGGQRIVILGGTSGMGLSTAELAVAAGADVVVSGRDRERLEDAVRRVRSVTGKTVAGSILEIEDRAAVREWIEQHAPVDHLVLPGSTVIPMRYDELTEDVARAAFESKFWGPFWTVFDARPHMRAGGSIVLFSGVAAQRPVPGYSVGAAIDGAIDALTRSLALELGPSRIRVNAVSPGAVLTPLWERLHGVEEAAEMQRVASERLPVGRVGTPEDGGGAAIFLMTNQFVCGHVVALDGGAQVMV